jgi:hypothetical protein
MPQLSPENYARVTAIVTRATLIISLEKSFPMSTPEEREQILIDVLSQIAHRCGYELRRFIFEEADGE